MQQNSRGATEHRTGKRKSIGKRKIPEQEESSSQPQSQQSQSQSQPQQQQTTISELLSRNQQLTTDDRSRPQQPSPTNKRARLSPTPSDSSSSALRSPGSMYNFSNSDSRAGGAFGQGSSGPKPGPSSATPRQTNFTPHTGARKLVVKNLRTTPRLDQGSYFEKIWGQLDAALGAVFGGGKPDISLEELYKGAENVCRQGKAADLAKKLQARCREHVSGKLRETLIAGSGGNIETLRAVVDTWSRWQSELVCTANFWRMGNLLMVAGNGSLDVLLSRSILSPPFQRIPRHT